MRRALFALALAVACLFSPHAAQAVGRLSSAVFLSSGSWTAPSGIHFVRVMCWGGGGAGGADGASGPTNYPAGGGGGSILIQKILIVSPGTTYTITIGAGGTAGTFNGSGVGSNGGAGGDTSFGALLTCPGASGGEGNGGGGSPVKSVGANSFGGTGTPTACNPGQGGAPGEYGCDNIYPGGAPDGSALCFQNAGGGGGPGGPGGKGALMTCDGAPFAAGDGGANSGAGGGAGGVTGSGAGGSGYLSVTWKD